MLCMDGEVHEIGGGLWFKIKAKRVEPTPERPHGIAYSLTLHDAGNRRIFAIDNAHAVSEGSGPGRRSPVEYDHRHKGERVTPYEYRSAADLLGDFFEAVDRELDDRGIER